MGSFKSVLHRFTPSRLKRSSQGSSSHDESQSPYDDDGTIPSDNRGSGLFSMANESFTEHPTQDGSSRILRMKAYVDGSTAQETGTCMTPGLTTSFQGQLHRLKPVPEGSELLVASGSSGAHNASSRNASALGESSKSVDSEQNRPDEANEQVLRDDDDEIAARALREEQRKRQDELEMRNMMQQERTTIQTHQQEKEALRKEHSRHPASKIPIWVGCHTKRAESSGGDHTQTTHSSKDCGDSSGYN